MTYLLKIQQVVLQLSINQRNQYSPSNVTNCNIIGKFWNYAIHSMDVSIPAREVCTRISIALPWEMLHIMVAINPNIPLYVLTKASPLEARLYLVNLFLVIKI
jgi:hypothetical protein